MTYYTNQWSSGKPYIVYSNKRERSIGNRNSQELFRRHCEFSKSNATHMVHTGVGHS